MALVTKAMKDTFHEMVLGDPMSPADAMLESINRLFKMALQNRGKGSFRELLEFSARYRNMAVFNMMMAYAQRPGALMLMEDYKWPFFGRQVKPEARPVIILKNFGPVSLLYDIEDTYQFRRISPEMEEFLYRMEHPFAVDGDIDEQKLKTLLKNLKFHGIAYDSTMTTGAGYGANLRLNTCYRPTLYFKTRDYDYSYESAFTINMKSSETDNNVIFASLAHELGHFFCKHLHKPLGWDCEEREPIGRSQAEFEAETTSYLVCQRAGIDNAHSADYLAGYMDDSGNIPDVNFGLIVNAVKRIEQTMNGITFEDGALWKYDMRFREMVKNARLERHVSIR